MTKSPVSDAAIQAACEKGKAAAEAAMAGSVSPLFVVDEFLDTPEERAEAMGWNSVYASAENKSRWDAYRKTSAKQP